MQPTRRPLAFLVLSLALAAPAAAEEWRDPAQRYQAAAESLARGEVSPSLEELRALDTLGYHPPGFFSLYGLALLAADDAQSAEAAFLRASQENPHDGMPRVYLGLLALRAEHPNQALAHFQAARVLLSADDPLLPLAEAQAAQLSRAQPAPLSLSLSLATQADSNALLTPDAAASKAAGARVQLDASAGYALRLGQRSALEASARATAALPVVNAATLAPLDPIGGMASLSVQRDLGAQFLLGAGSFGQVLRRDFGQEAFLLQAGAVATLQRGFSDGALRFSYRFAADDFSAAPDLEGTALDQDGRSHDLGLLGLWRGLSLGAAYAQTEADGNDFDRRSGTLQAGYRLGTRYSLSLGLAAALVDFPNHSQDRRDTRATASLQASYSAGNLRYFAGYALLRNDSSADAFTFTRHLVSLGATWSGAFLGGASRAATGAP